MADDTAAAPPPPDPSTIDPALIQQLLQQTLNPQPVAAPPGSQPGPSSQQGRGFLSLLGEALGGGEQYGTTAEREAGGLAALGAMGRSMLQGSDYSYQRHSLGSIIGQGMGAAQEALGQRQAVTAAQQAAQLDYQQKQQEMQLSRVKEAVPLLTLLQTQQQLAAARAAAGGGGTTPTTIGTAGTGGIGAVSGDTYEGAIAGHEGTGQNPNSSAAGVGQFITPTWLSFAAANPELFKGMSQDQILAARNNPAIGAQAITWLAQQNAEQLNKAGVTPSGTSLGIAHYLGAGAASKVMQAPDNAPVAGFVSQGALDANKELRTMTVGQLKQRYANTPAPAFLGGPKPGAAPPAATVAATPPPASTAQPSAQALPVPPIPPAAPPQTAFVPGANLPYGAPGPAPTAPQAALAPPAAPPPRTSTTLRGTGTPATPPLLPGGNQQLSQGEPVPAPYRIAGTDTGPPASSFGIIGQAARAAEEGAPPPVAPPLVTAQPQQPPAAETQPPAGPQRVPDQPPPYVRGPLPAEIQAAIDHPQIDPHLQTALNTARQGTDIKAMADANAAIAAATDKARAEAQTRAEAYHTAQQNIATEAWKVRRAEQAANDTALQKQAFDERQATISSANTRLQAEAADQSKHNTEIDTAMGNNADAATRVRGALAQARSTMVSLPSNPASLLSNDTTRPIVAGWFGGVIPSLATNATNADIFQSAINNAATNMSPKVLVGNERSSNVNQYKAMLPSLATSPEGRELAVNFADDMAENQQKTADWLTMNKENPEFMNKRLSTPDRDKAMVAMRADPSLKMPSLPPVPSTYDAKAYAASPTDQKNAAAYTRSITPGQPFYLWQPGQTDGRMHAVKNTWTRDASGKWQVVPGSAP